MSDSESPEPAERRNFIEARIDADLAAGTNDGRVALRFPPEPNGYLHIGHAKAICLNFGLAEEFEGATCNLRFDDTNPTKEKVEFVDSIQADIRWLGFEWTQVVYASDYFEQLYQWAEQLIQKGAAYVCDLPLDEMRAGRGDGRRPGTNSPYRDRTVDVNLDLFRRMRAGEFEDGARVLRAKIDMAAANMQLRDPVMYRILKSEHHRTGNAWCLYPTYDWAHGQSDAIEGITHSLCTLEFVNHRDLYEWFLEQLELEPAPRQYEMARLSLAYTMMSKRNLRSLVEAGHVSGWDDPRMPTISGLRRRGYTPKSLRAFCETIGVARMNSLVDMVVLENAVRTDLNRHAWRRMAVLDPIEVEISTWDEGRVEHFEAVNNPEDESQGTRKIALARTVYIDAQDFRMEAPRKFHRLKPGSEVRLRYGPVIRCDEVITDPESGEVVKLVCSHDDESFGGKTSDGRKVKGIVHWVSVAHSIEGEVRLYDHLFHVPEPAKAPEGGTFLDNLNPDSLKMLPAAKLEASLGDLEPGTRVQFERVGYFIADAVDHVPGRPVYNRTVGLRDTWAKLEQRSK